MRKKRIKQALVAIGAIAGAGTIGWMIAFPGDPNPIGPLGPLGAGSWRAYGADDGGSRYSGLSQVNAGNVGGLQTAWTLHTGDIGSPAFSDTALEVTPILARDSLYLCSAFGAIIAADPGSGQTRWRFDPRVSRSLAPGNHYACRGVAFRGGDAAAQGKPCADRVFGATVDGRLIALDAANGRPCADFGQGGRTGVLDQGGRRIWPGEVQITSPPVVAGSLVVVGSSISDAWRAAEPRGTVQAFDAMTGRRVWSYDPIPMLARSGAANVWAPIAYDAARNLLFLPTSSPSPDYYGALRPGANADADSVVALDAATGRKRWAFQTVHHDVWDYDLPAQPMLVSIRHGGARVDAVVQVTKTGFVFVLDRDTGRPLFPVVERPVPAGGAPGEQLSPTQPIPVLPAPLVPQRLTPDMAWGLTPLDRDSCRRRIAAARSDGLFTPPSLQGSIQFPFAGGGANWGGAAFDPKSNTLLINTSRAAQVITLVPRSRYAAERRGNPKAEVRPQAGTPFAVKRELLVSLLGLPCNPPPWGTLTAIDMDSGKVRWTSVLGTERDLAPLPIPLKLGTPNLGGPIVTAGGLVFIGAAMDNYLRAFDLRNGRELWKARLPGGGQATPMTYAWRGKQYVVIAAGGSSRMKTRLNDTIMAFTMVH